MFVQKVNNKKAWRHYTLITEILCNNLNYMLKRFFTIPRTYILYAAHENRDKRNIKREFEFLLMFYYLIALDWINRNDTIHKLSTLSTHIYAHTHTHTHLAPLHLLIELLKTTFKYKANTNFNLIVPYGYTCEWFP